MSCMGPEERAELADLVAQAVIDRMEERAKINTLADVVIQRIIAMQQEEAALKREPAGPTETQDGKEKDHVRQE